MLGNEWAVAQSQQKLFLPITGVADICQSPIVISPQNNAEVEVPPGGGRNTEFSVRLQTTYPADTKRVSLTLRITTDSRVVDDQNLPLWGTSNGLWFGDYPVYVSAVPPWLDQGNTYYWQVADCGGQNARHWSPVYTLRVKP
jgi:hypothetical protein